MADGGTEKLVGLPWITRSRERMTFASFAMSLLVVSSCAPAQSTSSDSARGQPLTQAAPKIVTIALATEPNSFGALGGDSQIVGQHDNVSNIVHDPLMSRTEGGGTEPRLATERPSTDRGTWTLNADGTMDTTFKLRPSIKWHDGT